ncbi:PIG-L family deacetylase [Streptomyces sp. rh34]|uniref:PIG-L family deacetylase n=1 Tax=Streptomyces sp. rh34 TaxID=2034272 RepID=UPI000BF09A5F|nr:PIG-L family deacetylase [Streptomyces sp. rh34]
MDSTSSILQIVAHPDDDLYFMNPTAFQAMKAGVRTTTVYLTSGDAQGENPRPWSTEPVVADREAYGRARQNGLRAAYAAMVLGDRTAAWTSGTWQTADGGLAEVYSLAAAPWVTLFFLNIRQHGTPEGPSRSLHVLWRGEAERVPTLVPRGGLVGDVFWYTRPGVVATLVNLMEIVRPTVIRTMDPDPDRLVHDENFPQRHDYGDLSDHCDHTAAALFSWTAISQYRGPAEGRHFAVEAFRGYYNERWPHNLSPQAVSLKEFFLNIYGAADGYDCGDPAGSGDYAVGLNSRGPGWVQSTTPRYPGTGDWLRPDARGRLTAFAVIDQQAAVWVQAQPGGDQWRGPFLLGGAPLAPGLAVSLTPDGRWQIFAERLSYLAHDDAHGREIVALEQAVPDGPFGEWGTLGNPSAADPRRDRHLGAPVVTRDGKGRLHLFVRNAGQGVHSRVRAADGTWGEWTDLRGFDVQEGLSALTARDGSVELFASSREGVFHWSQDTIDSLPSRAPRFKLSVPAGPPTALVQPGGGGHARRPLGEARRTDRRPGRLRPGGGRREHLAGDRHAPGDPERPGRAGLPLPPGRLAVAGAFDRRAGRHGGGHPGDLLRLGRPGRGGCPRQRRATPRGDATRARPGRLRPLDGDRLSCPYGPVRRPYGGRRRPGRDRSNRSAPGHRVRWAWCP